MTVNFKRLANAPVRTKMGTPVGRLASFEVDADTGKIVTLLVRVSGMQHLLESELIVPWSKIILLSEKEIVIADSTVPVGSAVLADRLAPPPQAV